MIAELIGTALLLVADILIGLPAVLILAGGVFLAVAWRLGSDE